MLKIKQMTLTIQASDSGQGENNNHVKSKRVSYIKDPIQASDRGQGENDSHVKSKRVSHIKDHFDQFDIQLDLETTGQKDFEIQTFWNVAVTPAPLGMTKRQEQAMMEALQNPLVLHEVMRDLTVPDYKACRLVSKSWKYISSHLMKKRDVCLVCLRYDCKRTLMHERCKWIKTEGNPTFPFSNTTPKSGGTSLECLNQLLENSIDFPCTHFMFQGGHLDSGGSQRFFELGGALIKTLALNEWCCHDYSSQSKPMLHSIFRRYTPNLENLTLESFPTLLAQNKDVMNDIDSLAFKNGAGATSKQDEEDKWWLPSLKNFTWIWTGSLDTPLEILRAAPNLQNITGVDDLDLLIGAGKIDAVTKLGCLNYIAFRDPAKLAHFTQNVFPFLKLQKFIIGGHSRKTDQILAAFSKILTVSRDSLQVLNMSTLCFDPGMVDLPKPLGGLRTLEFGPNFGGQRIFPPGLNLQKHFPNVKTLDCTLLSCHQDFMWQKYFPQPDPFCGPLAAVRSIKVNDQCTELWLKELKNLCPNFTSLVILSNFDLSGILPRVFHLWQHLEAIEVFLGCAPTPLSTCELDAAFTGMSKEDCGGLFERGFFSDHNKRIENWQELKINPSISDLKGLKRLKLVITSGRLIENSACLSHVSALYAFQLMPNLKVTIHLSREDYYSRATQKSFWETIVPAPNVYRQ